MTRAERTKRVNSVVAHVDVSRRRNSSTVVAAMPTRIRTKRRQSRFASVLFIYFFVIPFNVETVSQLLFCLYLPTNLVKIYACEEEHQRDDDESIDLEAVGEHVGAYDGTEDICQ